MSWLSAAPARPLGCAGALVLLLPLLSGCKDVSLRRQAKLDVGNDTITLAAGIKVHEVAVDASKRDFEPAALEIRTADVVKFTTADSHTHVITFDEPGLSASARQILESKTQLRSPPLLVKAATWVVSFEGAPAGVYAYRCILHGHTGRITIR